MGCSKSFESSLDSERGLDSAGSLFPTTEVCFKTQMKEIIHAFNAQHQIDKLWYYEATIRGGNIHGWIVGWVNNAEISYYFSISKFVSFVGVHCCYNKEEAINKGKGGEASEAKVIKSKTTTIKIGKLFQYANDNMGVYNKASSNCNHFAEKLWTFLG